MNPCPDRENLVDMLIDWRDVLPQGVEPPPPEASMNRGAGLPICDTCGRDIELGYWWPNVDARPGEPEGWMRMLPCGHVVPWPPIEPS